MTNFRVTVVENDEYGEHIGAYVNGLRTGEWTTTYLDFFRWSSQFVQTDVIEKGDYEEGVRVGVWKTWDGTGNLWYSGRYQRNCHWNDPEIVVLGQYFRTGTWKIWNREGDKYIKYVYDGTGTEPTSKSPWLPYEPLVKGAAYE